MTAPNWFDASYYLSNKLAQLRHHDPFDIYKDLSVEYLEGLMGRAGMTPYQHFLRYGMDEEVNPNAYFNAEEYFEAKVEQLNRDGINGHTDWTVEAAKVYFTLADISAWEHYTRYGAAESINPSNAFDETAYLKAKAEHLNKHQVGGHSDWDSAAVAEAFAKVGLNPVEHYLLHGQFEGLSVQRVAASSQVEPDPVMPSVRESEGAVIDGRIKGATVFADIDGDGVRDPNEPFVKTDAEGNFSATFSGAAAYATLVATGGTDIATNLPFAGAFSAPAGATVVTPLTTLVQSLVATGRSAASAEQSLKKAFGLPDDLDLKTFDATNIDSNASSATQAAAVKVYAAAAQVANLMAQVSSALDGAAGVKPQAAFQAVANAIASRADAAAASGQSLDLAAKDNIQDILLESAGASGSKAQAAIAKHAADAAEVMAGTNARVAEVAKGNDANAVLKDIAKVQHVAQGEAAKSLKDGVSGGDLSGAKDRFQGDKLDQAIDDADDAIGDVNIGDDDKPDQPATGGGNTGGDDTPEPTFTATVTDGVLSFGGTATGDIRFSKMQGDNVVFVRDSYNKPYYSDPVDIAKVEAIIVSDDFYSYDLPIAKDKSIDFRMSDGGVYLELPFNSYEGQALVQVGKGSQRIDLGYQTVDEEAKPPVGHVDDITGPDRGFVFYGSVDFDGDNDGFELAEVNTDFNVDNLGSAEIVTSFGLEDAFGIPSIYDWSTGEAVLKGEYGSIDGQYTKLIEEPFGGGDGDQTQVFTISLGDNSTIDSTAALVDAGRVLGELKAAGIVDESGEVKDCLASLKKGVDSDDDGKELDGGAGVFEIVHSVHDTAIMQRALYEWQDKDNLGVVDEDELSLLAVATNSSDFAEFSYSKAEGESAAVLTASLGDQGGFFGSPISKGGIEGGGVGHEYQVHIYVGSGFHQIDLVDEAHKGDPASGYAPYIEGANRDFVFYTPEAVPAGVDNLGFELAEANTDFGPGNIGSAEIITNFGSEDAFGVRSNYHFDEGDWKPKSQSDDSRTSIDGQYAVDLTSASTDSLEGWQIAKAQVFKINLEESHITSSAELVDTGKVIKELVAAGVVDQYGKILDKWEVLKTGADGSDADGDPDGGSGVFEILFDNDGEACRALYEWQDGDGTASDAVGTIESGELSLLAVATSAQNLEWFS
ncbi:hypothetical protein [Marichromatium bheemlicum]|uniref:Uncharacterized protein n=1 Tax=Marichromatium bheemlicum TaxID=365339 RepID=A0ABX1I9N1_9GAMM|nr:hypothetical protein [Marichromatium bheemlicum]NKN32895.1 hypothetical protein [Marichromatium bheemlicum]